MPNKTKIIKKIKSGKPDIYPDVDIYDSTLVHMHDSGHLEELSRIDEIYTCIADPKRIYKSKTNQRSICIVSDKIVSAGGSPLRIPIKIVSSTEAIMSSAYFATGREGELIWSDEDE